MGLSGQIVLSKLQVDSDEYLIYSSCEDIVLFITKDENGEEVYETSPQALTIELYKNYNDKENEIDFKSNYRFYMVGHENESEKLTDYISFGDQIEDQDRPNRLIFNVQEFVRKSEVFKWSGAQIFIFEYVVNNKVLLSRAFQVRNGITDEMAKFNVTAASINASVEDSGLAFTANGLEITNGDFKIKKYTGRVDDNGDKIYEQLFGFETEQIGEQNISKLTMRGTVYAEDGKFTGKIHATDAAFDSGTIGGFNIADDKLVSEGVVSENNADVPAIELNGKSGKIIAHSIELGEFATVRNQIRLGTTGFACLYNPNENDGKFIQSGNILIKNDGTAKFGDISIDGANSQIYGNTWNIGKDYANFSNVNVSGSIETAVFKTNSVQAAGGAMIFRPSYKGSLKNENGTFVVYLESAYEGAIKNQVQVVFDGDNQGYFGTIKAVEQDKITINWSTLPTQEKDSIVLIDYGCDTYVKVAYNYPIKNEKYYALNGKEYSKIKIEDNYSIFSKDVDSDYLSSTDLFVDVDVENNEILKSENELIVEDGLLINSIRNFYTLQDDILIGINSGRSGAGVDGKILPRGLTLTSLKETIPKLYLGDLRQVGSDYSGYGLYADNVYLNGSLTTKVGENSYAGVNTLNGISATAFSEGFDKKEVPTGADVSKIVFWAGADSIDSEDIAKAYFQVTEAGSLYAQRAKLEDTLLVGGIIKAAEIHTAELHGREGALSIYDGTKGIQFIKGGNQNPERVIFSINTSGLIAGDKTFVSITNNDNDDNENKITILGDYVRTSNGTSYLSLETLEKDGGTITPVLKHSEGENNCGFYFEKTQTAFKMNESSIQTWTVEETKIHNSLELNREGCSMQYKREDNGYNLYIVMR